MRRAAASLLVALALLAIAPDLAHACPVCFDPREENRAAFLATTVFLSVFPLSLLGGIGLWLRKRMRDVADQADSPEHDRTP